MKDTPLDRIKRAEEDIDALKEFVSVCKVSTVNKKKRTATVIMGDGETVSESFPILSRGESTEWIPSVGQNVVCLVRPGGDGIILGGIS